MELAQLHLVDAQGAAVSPAIGEAAESAFRWVSRDFPNLDKAKLADWAEAVAASMQVRGSAIESPERYAYAALKGKVRDWLRTAPAREETVGVSLDLERLGGSSRSFQGTTDRKILFDQLQAALTERDRAILVLLLNDKSAQEIATGLTMSQPAARKAIQRLKERAGVILEGSRSERKESNLRAKFCEVKG